jgi:serine/threonine-protein kinase
MQLSRIGPIALEEPLGGSADSNVLRGVHLDRNMAMAVKLLPRELVNRPMAGDTFAADVKALQKLVHPHIARCYGGAMDNGQPYLAMELVKGESLRTLLDRRGRLPWETTVDLAVEICEALDFAHHAGVAHLRLTPSRVLLTETGDVKLIGFDSKLSDRDEVLGLRVPMSVANYLAPEAFRGKLSAKAPTCDLFSLGAILYECLAGKVPWPADSPAELIQARRNGPAPRASASVLECPVWLDVLVARLLELKRTDRLPTADAARRAILDAKSKTEAGMGAVQHAWAGKQGALATDADRKELAALRKKQVVRERDDSPFYERAWFLAACLAVIVAAATWAMWPKSKAALLAAAAPLMASDDPVQWKRAEDQYLSQLVERFPEMNDDPAVREFRDRYAVHRAKERVKNIDRFGRRPKSEIERLYAEGWRKERFGDLESALRLYRQVLDEPAPDPKATTDAAVEQRAYQSLAHQRIGLIKSEVRQKQDSSQLLRNKLDEAKELSLAGKALQAQILLDDVVQLYGNQPEFKALVDEARELLDRMPSSPSK